MLAATDASQATALDIATFVIAVLALMLATLGLGWQVLTHFLTGGRVKAELLLGATNAAATSMVTALATQERLTDRWIRDLAEQGYIRPIFAVRVRNVGRLPVTVERWSLTTSQGINLTPLSDSIGPDLPHRLEAGMSETWALGGDRVVALVEATKGTFNLATLSVGGKVELADGRTCEAAQRIRL
jgi:hypothetical protein